MRALDTRIIGVMLFLFLALGSSGQQIVQYTNQITQYTTNEPTAPNIWRDGIGSGFNSRTWSVGVMAGAGPGLRVLGSTEHHGIALANVNIAWILPEWGRTSFLAGNLQFRGELFGGAQFHPNTRWVTGLTIMARYTFATGCRWVPFIDGGAGPSGTDIGLPDLGDNFEFNVQVGGGTYYFFRKNTAVSLEYRWLHLSDAGLSQHNNGINAQMIQGGVTWFF